MIAIQVKGQELDINSDAEVIMQSKSFRFNDSMAEPYSNDFELPKTAKNLHILGAAGLLDITADQLNDDIPHVTLTVGGRNIHATMHVVSVTDNVINIYVKEDVPWSQFIGHTLNEYLQDNWLTRWRWDSNAVIDPNIKDNIVNYKYSDFGLDHNFAIPHPSMPLNDILQQISPVMPSIPTKYRLIASNPVLVPEEPHQTIEINRLFTDGKKMAINGGQHITNGLEYDDNGTFEIEYNRDCDVVFTFYFAYEFLTTITANDKMKIVRTFDDDDEDGKREAIYTKDIINFPIPYGYGVFTTTMLHIQANDRISFELDHKSKFSNFSAVVDAVYINYTITDDDYGNELKYIARQPRLMVKSHKKWDEDGWDDWVYHEKGDAVYSYVYFDGAQYVLKFDRFAYNEHNVTVNTVELAFSYFYYYASLPLIELDKLLFDLQYVLNKKLSFDAKGNMMYVDAYSTEKFDAQIDSIAVTGSQLAQKNYILYSDDTTDNAVPVLFLRNQLLEPSKTIHTVIFVHDMLQYTNGKRDWSTKVGKCDYEPKDGCFLGEMISDNMMVPAVVQDAGFSQISRYCEVTMTTRDKTGNTDYLIVDGHKYMVAANEFDARTGMTTITAMQL